MYTYSDFEEYAVSEKSLLEFIGLAIAEHQTSKEYKIAQKAKAYYKHQNPDIEAVEKVIYDMLGQAHKDLFSPNHKLANAYYPKIINQGVSHLLANGISFKNPDVKKQLGANLDGVCKKILTDAKNSGVSYGYFDGKRLIHFPFEQFKAIYDDYTGEIRAGIRFTQIDENKPLSITLYEADGFSEFVREPGEEITRKSEKKRYDGITVSNEIEGVYEQTGETTSRLPIYPMYNIGKQSDIVGNLNILIAIDLVNSNLVNNVSQGELVYWVLKNQGGMDEVDDANFLLNLIKRHVIHLDGDGSDAQPHQIQVPFEANQTAAAMLKRQLYDNMDGVLTETLNAGNLTATAISSAYSDLRQHSSNLEYEVIEFLHGIFRIAGIPEDEEITFSYYETINQSEMIQNILACGQNFDDEEMTRLLCSAIGNIDNFESIQKRKAANAMARANLIGGDNNAE
jgi:hypothetical protein